MAESPNDNRAATFSQWTDGLFNIAKIVALLGAALWTLLEWNVSIFPKESHEELLRKAQKRTSLAIKLGDIQTHRLDETTQAAGSNDQQRLLFIGECSFTNERNFPIALQAQQLTVRFAAGTKDLPTPGKDTGGVNAFQIQWSDDIEIDYDTAFGPVNEGRNATILEPRGRNVIPLCAPPLQYQDPSYPRAVFLGGDGNVCTDLHATGHNELETVGKQAARRDRYGLCHLRCRPRNERRD